SVVQNRRNEQDGIGAPLDRFQNLALIDEEVLPQQRKGNRRTNLLQIFQRALKEFFIRQDRETGRAASFVLAGNSHRVEVRTNDTGRRRRLLDFGDQRNRSGPGLSQGGAKVAARTVP